MWYESDMNNQQREAKMFALSIRIETLYEAIGQRINSLATIASLAAGATAIVLTVAPDRIQHPKLAVSALALLTLVALGSFGLYLLVLRGEVADAAKSVATLHEEDWSQKPPSSELPKVDCVPETIFAFLVVGVLLFVVSLIKF